ncbi:hypothetical protein [Kaarinaea lacus]
MDNVINFKALGNNWYEGNLRIDGQKLTVTGICEKNPAIHLQSAYQFFIQGGMRAQCVFNQDSACHLIVMRRDDGKTDNIVIEVVKLNEKFENNAKLRSNNYLDANVVFSASIPLTQFATAIS